MTCTASLPASVTRRRREVAGPVKVIQPELPWPLQSLNCMGAGEEAPPRVHTRAKPVSDTEGALILCGRENTLNMLLLSLEVTSRPRVGQAAKPTPRPHMVLRDGTGTRSPRLMVGKEQL
jgi:hypothetical protein